MSLEEELLNIEAEFNKMSILPIAPKEQDFTLEPHAWAEDEIVIEAWLFPNVKELIQLIRKQIQNKQPESKFAPYRSELLQWNEQIKSPLTIGKKANEQEKDFQSIEEQAGLKLNSLKQELNKEVQDRINQEQQEKAKVRELEIEKVKRDNIIYYHDITLNDYIQVQQQLAILTRKADKIAKPALKSAVNDLIKVLKAEILKQPVPIDPNNPGAELKDLQETAKKTCAYLDKVEPSVRKGESFELGTIVIEDNPVDVVKETEKYYNECTQLPVDERIMNGVGKVAMMALGGLAVAALFMVVGILCAPFMLPATLLIGIPGFLFGVGMTYSASQQYFGKNNERGFFAKPYQKQIEAIALVNASPPPRDDPMDILCKLPVGYML